MSVVFRTFFVGFCFGLLTTLLTVSVVSASADRGKIQDRDTRSELVFSAHERQMIHDYYRQNLPPGLAKRSQLPPGLAKRSTLPPGLSGEHLPKDLESRLSRLPEGYTRMRVGTDVVLIDVATQVVLDVIQDIGH